MERKTRRSIIIFIIDILILLLAIVLAGIVFGNQLQTSVNQKFNVTLMSHRFDLRGNLYNTHSEVLSQQETEELVQKTLTTTKVKQIHSIPITERKYHAELKADDRPVYIDLFFTLDGQLIRRTFKQSGTGEINNSAKHYITYEKITDTHLIGEWQALFRHHGMMYDVYRKNNKLLNSK